ncbi:MAG: hypothetical protein KDD41_07585, partial [Flavobacteriales bacterium]|nr:hypothetical protein [Flavobacteriales bacterium]
MRKLFLFILLLAFAAASKANCGSGLVSVPVVDSITVDTAGNVTICWQSVPDPDIDYYIIFMYNPVTGANDSINMVNSGGNCFTLPAGQNNSDFETVELSVVGVDVCDNASTSGVNYHNTILLEYTVNICSATINLNWSPYDDFNSGLNVDYKVYVSKDGAPYSFIGNTTTTNFSYAGITQGSTYNFYVRGYENNGAGPASSSSNDVKINTINFLKDPQFNYLYTATVVDSQDIMVQFYVDTAADVSHYNIKRKEADGDAFTLISTVPAYTGMNPM